MADHEHDMWTCINCNNRYCVICENSSHGTGICG